MGRWTKSYIHESPKQIFKIHFMICGIFGLFALVNVWRTIYSNSEHTKGKWKGSIIGTLVHLGALALTGVFGAGLGLTPISIAVFCSYIIFLILFGILYKPK